MILKTILDWLNANEYEVNFKGDKTVEINGFASLSNYQSGKITWIKKNENYNAMQNDLDISCAVVQEGIDLDIANQILSKNSKEVYFAILHHFWGSGYKKGFVGEGTFISSEVEINPSAYIGHNCTIDGRVKIGADTIIENNVVIQGNVIIGDRCHIQSQTVIGIDGFGYSKDPISGKKTMVEHFGGISIGNDVFIASHVNIARGTIDDTIISDGVKIAPSTHIGHNNFIGENTTIICSQIYGSCSIGKDSYVTAGTIQNQITIGEHTVIGMGSVVTKPIPDNVVAFGIPAKISKDNNTDL